MLSNQRTARGPYAKKRLETATLQEREAQTKLETAINQTLDEDREERSSPSEIWTALNRNVYQAAAGVLRYTTKNNSDRFNENDEEKKLLEERNRAVQAKLSNPSRDNQDRLRRARAEVSRFLRACFHLC